MARAIRCFFTNGGEDCQTKGKWEQVKRMYSMHEVRLRSRVWGEARIAYGVERGCVVVQTPWE